MKIKHSIKEMKVENVVLLLLSFFIILFLVIIQIAFINPYASTWDQVDFALAVTRYDLLAMQPHFPGYPYFILGGKIFSVFLDSPIKALTMFNLVLYSTTLYPVYKLGKRYLTREKSFLLAVTLYSSSYVLLLVNQPISEGAAISILLWYIWGLEKSIRSKNTLIIILPMFLLSVLLGIRLSYIPFGVGILYLLYMKWSNKEIRSIQVILYGLLGVAFQFIWVIAIALTEGSIMGFVKLAMSFTSGHFQDWGGSVGSNSLAFPERMTMFITNNIIWTGFFAQSKLLMVVFVVITLFLLSSLGKVRFSIDRFFTLIIFLMISYFIWALIAQNIDKPRHIIPIVSLCFLLYFIYFIQKSNRIGLVLLFIYLSVQLIYTTHLLKEQATQLPATYQLERFLEKKKEPFILYTWEETRVLQNLKATFPHKRLQTYEFFKLDSSYYQHYEILMTDKVLLGFENQGINTKVHIEKIAEFYSNTLFDPVYDRITLYKWKKDRGGQHE